MASNVAATITRPKIKDFEGSIHSYTLSTGDDGKKISNVANKRNISIQVVGTISGSTVTLQGSNDGTNWATLKDTQGSDIALTSVGIKTLIDRPLYVRPIITGGTASGMTVIIVLCGN